MSLREELEAVIAAKAPWWGYHAHAVEFIEKHGQALLDALEDAGRYRYVRRKEAWREVQDNPHDGSIGAIYVGRGDRGGGNALDTEELDDAIDAARRKTADQAIDAAIKGDG